MKKISIVVIFLIIVVGILLFVGSLPHKRPAVLQQGQVIALDSTPIPEVNIVFKSDDSIEHSTTTDEMGMFKFQGIEGFISEPYVSKENYHFYISSYDSDGGNDFQIIGWESKHSPFIESSSIEQKIKLPGAQSDKVFIKLSDTVSLVDSSADFDVVIDYELDKSIKDWSMDVSVNNGKVLGTTSEDPLNVPKGGYKEVWNLSKGSSNKSRFYFNDASGNTGWIKIHFLPFSFEGPVLYIKRFFIYKNKQPRKVGNAHLSPGLIKPSILAR